MSLKATIHEQCEYCGERTGRRVGRFVTRLSHECSVRPISGPRGAPARFREDEVVFVPGDFTAEQLRVELEEAWLIIADMRNKRWTAEENAVVAVRKAMRETFNPSSERESADPHAKVHAKEAL